MNSWGENDGFALNKNEVNSRGKTFAFFSWGDIQLGDMMNTFAWKNMISWVLPKPCNSKPSWSTVNPRVFGRTCVIDFPWITFFFPEKMVKPMDLAKHPNSPHLPGYSELGSSHHFWGIKMVQRFWCLEIQWSPLGFPETQKQRSKFAKAVLAIGMMATMAFVGPQVQQLRVGWMVYNGKPYEQMDDLVGETPPIFLESPIWLVPSCLRNLHGSHWSTKSINNSTEFGQRFWDVWHMYCRYMWQYPFWEMLLWEIHPIWLDLHTFFLLSGMKKPPEMGCFLKCWDSSPSNKMVLSPSR